jgi:hypothetical protein
MDIDYIIKKGFLNYDIFLKLHAVYVTGHQYANHEDIWFIIGGTFPSNITLKNAKFVLYSSIFHKDLFQFRKVRRYIFSSEYEEAACLILSNEDLYKLLLSARRLPTNIFKRNISDKEWDFYRTLEQKDENFKLMTQEQILSITSTIDYFQISSRADAFIIFKTLKQRGHFIDEHSLFRLNINFLIKIIKNGIIDVNDYPIGIFIRKGLFDFISHMNTENLCYLAKMCNHDTQMLIVKIIENRHTLNFLKDM